MMRITVIVLTQLICLCIVASFNFQDVSLDQLDAQSFALQGPFASVSDAKLLLGVPEVSGTSKEGQPFACSPTIIRLSNLQNLDTDVQRPQVLISGEIHGDERVGPSATYTATKIMILATQCLGIHKIYQSGSGYGRGANKDQDKEEHNACKQLSNEYSIIDADSITWLALLATKRDSFILPAANCYGYKLSVRKDATVDVNRDFGYIRHDEQCLASSTARMLNALMLKSMLQVVVTFHGGMQAIGYEWGSPNHSRKNSASDEQSPDDLANRMIGGSMQVMGGSDGSKSRRGFTSPYPTGPMNSLVYPVEGGMEDWMYAAGWDTTAGAVHKCSPHSQTEVPDNRALVFLIETSDEKRPQDKDLGGSEHILEHALPAGLQGAPGGNGHVPRNVRAALVAIDAVQPYVCIRSTASANNNKELLFQWSVGGGATVDATWLQWHPVGASEEEMYAHAGDDTFLRNTLRTPQPPLSSRERRGLNIGGTEGVFRGMGMESRGKGGGRGGRGGRGQGKHQRTYSRRTSISTAELPIAAASTQQAGLALWGQSTAASSIGAKAPLPSKISSKEDPLKQPFGAVFSAKVTAIPPVEMKAAAKSLSFFSSINKDTGEQEQEDHFWIVAWAGVDLAFGKVGQGSPKELGPQGLLSNARADHTYHRSNPQSLGLHPKDTPTIPIAAATFPASSSASTPVTAAEKTNSAEQPLQPRVVQGREYWPSDPVLVAVNRKTGSMRVVAASLSCAFWARSTVGMNDKNKNENKNIGEGGLLVGADGHGIPPKNNNPHPHPHQPISSIDGNQFGSSAVGGLSEQLTIAKGSADSDITNGDAETSSAFLRAYSLAIILFIFAVALWLAKKVLHAYTTSANAVGEGAGTGSGTGTGGSVAMRDRRDKADWQRSANFKV